MKHKNAAQNTYALIGYPLRHSVSPMIHTKLCALKGTEISYSLCEIEESSAASQLRGCLHAFDGFNVTIPYKETIIPLLDGLSQRAALFGAVNTVCITKDGAIGHNTDCEGFLRSAKAAHLPIGGRVVIIGCGGVSRMFAFECLLAGASVTLAIRRSSLPKAQRLQKEAEQKLGKTVDIVMTEAPDGEYDLLINGTPVGMFPNADACPVSESQLHKCGAVFDAVYNPLKTKLLRLAEAAQIPAVGGLPMLVWQAAVAEERWHGFTFSEAEAEEVIAAAEKELSGNE